MLAARCRVRPGCFAAAPEPKHRLLRHRYCPSSISPVSARSRHCSKFLEIRKILKDDGKFILSYINFGHFRGKVWPNYNNVQSIAEMKRALSKYYRVDSCFPASHHWRQKQPGKRALRPLQMHVNFNIPVVSPMMAVEYFFICSPLR